MEGTPAVIGASDRMLTSADITFEPPATKIYTLTNAIHVLIAGDATVHAEIYPKVAVRINKMISAKPSEWVKVEEAARIYGDETLQYRKRTSARLVLEPLGLTWDTFLSKQKDMSPDFLDDISSKILEMRADSRVIVAGLDESGAHIWVVDGYGKASCGDKAGFVAIGIGKRHAESEFMFDGHSPNSTFYETLLRIYAAKKRAEVAPGVGERTDMFIIAALGTPVLMLDEEREVATTF
jgi:20S proteasome alpha/beta subunit